MAGLMYTVIKRLLPSGRALKLTGQGAQVIESLGVSLERPKEFLRAVQDESLPYTATATIDEWLALLGIAVSNQNITKYDANGREIPDNPDGTAYRNDSLWTGWSYRDSGKGSVSVTSGKIKATKTITSSIGLGIRKTLNAPPSGLKIFFTVLSHVVSGSNSMIGIQLSGENLTIPIAPIANTTFSITIPSCTTAILDVYTGGGSSQQVGDYIELSALYIGNGSYLPYQVEIPVTLDEKRKIAADAIAAIGGQSLDYINSRIQAVFPNVYIEESGVFSYIVLGFYPYARDFSRIQAIVARTAPLHLVPTYQTRSVYDGDVARCGIGSTGREITGRSATAYSPTDGQIARCGVGVVGIEITGRIPE